MMDNSKYFDMKENEIIQNNKLIAEFIGMQNTNIGWYDNNEVLTIKDNNTFDELLFHSSWDWLMPVVRKIVDLCINDGVEGNFKEDWTLFESEQYTSILNTVSLAIIEDSYKVVVEFIKWYNETKNRE
jgi:hypothetical protein